MKETGFAIERVPLLPSLVNSRILFDYLVDSDYMPSEGLSFSSNLDLSLYKPFFDFLASNSRDVFVHSGEERQEMAGAIDKLVSLKSSGTGDIIDNIKSLADLTTVGERGFVIYYDVDKARLAATDVSFGEFGQTSINFPDVFTYNHVPVLMVHTHPTDTLFSPQDYLPILLGNPQNGYRWLKGSVVICPQTQYLALTTPESLIMTSDEIQAKIAEWNRQYEAEVVRYRQVYNEGVAERVRKISEITILAQTRFNAYVEEVASLQKELDFPVSLGGNLIDRFSEEARNEFDQELAMREKQVKGYIDQELTEIHRRQVKIHLTWAQEAGVRLYSSTDMCRFHEFSA